jgi:hypothetical protein
MLAFASLATKCLRWHLVLTGPVCAHNRCTDEGTERGHPISKDREAKVFRNFGWREFFALMHRIDVPEDFMADRPMNAPPVERALFDDCE